MRKAIFVLSLLFAAQIIFAQDDSADRKVEETLKTRRVTFSFQDAPLIQVVNFLQDVSRLNFVLDPNEQKMQDICVTMRLRDTPLSSVLNLILESQGLAFCVKDGAVFISTKAKIAEITGKVSKIEGGEVKPGEALFLLTDGSRIKGVISITELQLKTSYGTLTIPTNDILEIRFQVLGKESQAIEDEVKTVKFTVTGSLLIEKFEVKTTGGTLAISKADVEKILLKSESSVKLEPGKKEWETAAAGALRTIATTVETLRIKHETFPASETSARDGSGNDRLLFEGTRNRASIDPSAAQSYTFKYTRIDNFRWTCTADTDRSNLRDFYIDQTGVLRAAPSTGDGCQATDKSDPYSG